MHRRAASLILVLAVAYAYATGVAGTAPTLRAGSQALAGDTQPAICPVTRPSLHLGRQVEGRAGMPLGLPAGLPPDDDCLRVPGWARARVAVAESPRPQPVTTSSRSSRGPPAAVSRHLES